MSDQIQRPTCAVKGSLYGGRAMCGRVINAEFCGSSDPCEHKVDRNALEEKKVTVEQNPAPDVALVEALRDQFAMHAMKVFLVDEHGAPTLETVAEYAYKMADAMLKERDK